MKIYNYFVHQTSTFFSITVFLLCLAAFASNANAATYTWDGGGATNNFSEAANWSGDIVPTGADTAFFGNTSVKNCTIDQTTTVTQFLIAGNYTGTIQQTAVLNVTGLFNQDGGTFQGSAANATFGVLLLTATANFVAPSGTLSLNSQTAYYLFEFRGGTFNANGGTVSVDGRSDLNYFRYGAMVFNNLIVNKPLTLLDNAITVNGDLTLNEAFSNIAANVNGNVSFGGTYTNGSAVLKFGGTATRTATLDGATIKNPIEVNNANLTLTTVTTSGTVTWNQKVTLIAGTLQQTAANYLFNVGAGFNNPGFSVAGGTFQGGAGNATFNTTIGISAGNLNGGSGSLGTDASVCPSFPVASYYFQQSGGAFNGGSGANKFCDLRRTGGSFTATSGTTTILSYADFTGGNAALGASFTASGGTFVIADGVTIYAQSCAFFNVTLQGTNGHGLDGAPKPIINGTFNLAEGTYASGSVAVNGSVVYGANFAGGGGRLFFDDAATRTVNLPARNVLLGMTLDNPNITVTTSGAGASTFVNTVEVKRGLLQQGNAVLNFGSNGLTVSGGTFQGSAADLNVGGIIVSGGALQGGTGSVNVAGAIETTGGTFSTGGDMNISTYRQSGGTFNAPSGLLTVVADWTHTAGGTFNGGTGTVKFTGYNTFNCANTIGIDVATTETFNNLIIANQFCNVRYIATGDTLIINGDFRIAYGNIGGGRIRPLGTTTIDATNNGYVGSPIVEYIAPNRNFIINNPSSTVNMFPVEMSGTNSTLTSSGTGRINFVGMTLTNGTVNQGAGIWDITNPGYAQSGGTFNGSQAELFVANGAGNPVLTGGVFNSGAGKVTGSFRITGGTMSIAGDMDTVNLSIEGGTFNAPLGTLSIFQGFSHTLGGTFNARTGTVKTSTTAGVYGIGIDVNSTETFNNLQFNGTYNNANHIIGAGDTLIVNGTLNFNGRGVSGGSIVANGDVSYTNYGGYQNATTVVKFQDTAARVVTFSNDCTSYFQPTLVDNPNITINSGCDQSGANLTWTSLDLRQGTVNAGNARSGFTGNFTQSGGIFNGGTNTTSPATSISGDYTLSGGTFNAAPSTAFGANYTHTAGGTFNYGTGTVIFGGSGGTIDVNATENFNNVRFEQAGTGTTKTIANGDTLVANGNLEFVRGYVSGGTLEAKGNVSIGAGNQFSGGSTALNFTGAADQTYTNAGGISTSGTWTINKPNSSPRAENGFAPAAVTGLLISGNIGNNGSQTLVPLNVVSGRVAQTGNYNHALASLTLAANTTFVNEFGGTITLGGDVVNNGFINLNANGTGCQTDAIFLRSTSAAQRAWSGDGNFLLVDVDVNSQSGSAPIRVYNGTNSGNNGANFTFDTACFAPTAAPVFIGGRILTAEGRGIFNATVVLISQSGERRFARTNPFGFYLFQNVPAGAIYTLIPQHKTRRFSGGARSFSANYEVSNFDFVADPLQP